MLSVDILLFGLNVWSQYDVGRDRTNNYTEDCILE